MIQNSLRAQKARKLTSHLQLIRRQRENSHKAVNKQGEILESDDVSDHSSESKQSAGTQPGNPTDPSK